MTFMSNNDRWYQLDNAAKMFPSTAQGSDTKVFRICCELNEEVVPSLLQQALEKTAEVFPHFGCILKRGFFWYYLESRDIKPEAVPDVLPPCSPVYIPGRKNLLYRVIWYRNRISLEMFHVLTDGTGAFDFFKELLIRYLCLAHSLAMPDRDQSRASVLEKESDAFSHYYDSRLDKGSWKELTKKHAYQLREKRDENHYCHLLEGSVSASAFLAIAHDYSATIGVLACSLVIESVIATMRKGDRRFPVIISIPVNLRQFFPSDTARNFFGVINVAYDANKYDGTLQSILGEVRSSFERQLTMENIEDAMNSYAGLEHHPLIRIVPLFIKDPVVEWFYKKGRRGITCTISNLGMIRFPAEYAKYIHHFVPYMTSQSLTICMSSFGDVLSFGSNSGYTTQVTMLSFYRRLTELGLEVCIASNDHEAVPGPQNSSGRKLKKKEGKKEKAKKVKKEKKPGKKQEVKGDA